MKVTVYGPNLPRELSDKGTLVIHKAGCADTASFVYRSLGEDQGRWGLDADTVADVVEAIYPAGDFLYDPTDEAETAPYRDDIYFFPCTAGLVK